MIAALSAIAVVGLAFAAYYVRLHVEWRKEVRRRRADRERERELMRGFACAVDERGGVE